MTSMSRDGHQGGATMGMKKKMMALMMVAVMAWSINAVVFAEENQPQATDTTVASAPAETVVAPEEKQEAPAATPEASEEPQAQAEATPAPTVEPETTAEDKSAEPEIAQEPAEEEPTEEEMIPAGDEEIVPDLSNVKIQIHCLNSGEVQIGDSVTLAVSVEGADGLSYSIQWQYYDGTEWKNQSGACDTTITYTLTKDNADYAWRVTLTIA